MNYRKIAALAALASKYNMAGESAEKAEKTVDYLLSCLDANPSEDYTGTGGIYLHRLNDGITEDIQLFLDLGYVRSRNVE